MESARYKKTFYFWKETRFIIAISLLILITALLFRQSLYGVFGEQNYLSVHLILEFFIVTIAFIIAIQSWMVFFHNLSSFRLWIGALFLAVGLIEIVHAITFKGMPFFLGESSPYRATWFFMVGRLTEVAGILTIILMKDRLISSKIRSMAYGLAILYTLIWVFLILSPGQLLPELVKEGIGTTTIKNNLQYVGIVLELFVLYFVAIRLQTKQVFNTMLMVASVYLILSDYFFTTYKSVYDINNFIGHLFQLAGYYFLQRGVYHSSVEEPFQKQKEAEERLKENEKNLEARVLERTAQLENANQELQANIAERKRTEEKMKELTRKLSYQMIEIKAVNKELETFSYSVSHDLRAPLRSIDGFSQALLEDYESELDEDGKDFLHRIRKASQRMSDLIDDLLKLSRLTRSEINGQEVNLSDIAEQIWTQFRQEDQSRQVTFTISPNIYGHGDSRLLHIVLENLISNAWKFTSYKQEAMIEFGYFLQDSETVYFIKDNGAGFDMAYADKLFGTFQRLHSPDLFPGNGIGLATVQRIIHRHGGRVWAEGEENEGATFYFTLNHQATQ